MFKFIFYSYYFIIHIIYLFNFINNYYYLMYNINKYIINDTFRFFGREIS